MTEEPVYKIHVSWFIAGADGFVLVTQSQLACAVEAVVQEIMGGLVLLETP